MNLATIKHRFSVFFSQMGPDDVELLMDFLELILGEYKQNPKIIHEFLSIKNIDAAFDQANSNEKEIFRLLQNSQKKLDMPSPTSNEKRKRDTPSNKRAAHANRDDNHSMAEEHTVDKVAKKEIDNVALHYANDLAATVVRKRQTGRSSLLQAPALFALLTSSSSSSSSRSRNRSKLAVKAAVRTAVKTAGRSHKMCRLSSTGLGLLACDGKKSEKSVQERNRKRGLRHCAVCACDNYAIGVHYGVVSCSSCAKFYSNCRVNPTTRKNMVCRRVVDELLPATSGCSLQRINGRIGCSKCRYDKFNRLERENVTE